ncbi:hypothetical protein [Variovorax boronicumulans]|uniref:hypothetical protein n=1 Tax=Variovorax boronicumulans TaxID=436515 RepID=UPI0033970560
MLSTAHKADILRKAGYDLPSQAPQVHLQGDTAAVDAANWSRVVDALYVDYASARAAKSLRDAEEAQQSGVLLQPYGFRAYA